VVHNDNVAMVIMMVVVVMIMFVNDYGWLVMDDHDISTDNWCER
jgi:hypothetical protein